MSDLLDLLDFLMEHWWISGAIALFLFWLTRVIDSFAAANRRQENVAMEALYGMLRDGMTMEEVVALTGNAGTRTLDGDLETVRWAGTNGQVLEVELRAGRLAHKRLIGLTSS